MILALLCTALLTTGCTTNESSGNGRAGIHRDWRSTATESDRRRLRAWRTAWMRGLDKARAAGHADAIDQEGVLLNPDAALPWRDPAPGIYGCRTIKIGAQSAGTPDFVLYPPFDCRIEITGNGTMRFAKLNGSQRPVGRLLPDADDRMIFLGTLQLGDETRTLEYGRDQERDLIGILERIDENRWRMVFPLPHFESTVDILELVRKVR